jgi:membrane protease YdiL (CAAX protease family)
VSSVTPSSNTVLSDRALAGWEIVSVVSSIAIAEWMLASAAGLTRAVVAIPVVLAFALMLSSHRVRAETFRELGFRLDNFFRAMWLLLLPMAVAAAVCVLVAWRLGATIDLFRWHPNRNLLLQMSLGFAWALAQQYVLQSFLNRRAMLVAGAGWPSILIVSLVFGLLHLPNLWVTAITVVAGAIFAAVYQRAPNLFALALTHAVMTWFIVSTLPQSALRHLRVGFGYFT